MYPIPANATRIRYLESTGTQYIDLPTYTLGQNTIVEVLIEAVETSGDIKLFGSHPVFLVAEYNSKWRFYQNVWTLINVEVANATNVKVRSTSKGVEFISNGETIYSNNNRARAADDLHPVIGGLFTASSGSISKGKGRYKGLRILEGSTIAHDYVPVRVGQVGYLFDRVSGTLFGNAGTGDFVLGPDTFSQGVVPTRMMAMGVRKESVAPGIYVEFDNVTSASAGLTNYTDTLRFDLTPTVNAMNWSIWLRDGQTLPNNQSEFSGVSICDPGTGGNLVMLWNDSMDFASISGIDTSSPTVGHPYGIDSGTITITKVSA